MVNEEGCSDSSSDACSEVAESASGGNDATTSNDPQASSESSAKFVIIGLCFFLSCILASVVVTYLLEQSVWSVVRWLIGGGMLTSGIGFTIACPFVGPTESESDSSENRGGFGWLIIGGLLVIVLGLWIIPGEDWSEKWQLIRIAFLAPSAWLGILFFGICSLVLLRDLFSSDATSKRMEQLAIFFCSGGMSVCCFVLTLWILPEDLEYLAYRPFKLLQDLWRQL